MNTTAAKAPPRALATETKNLANDAIGRSLLVEPSTEVAVSTFQFQCAPPVAVKTCELALPSRLLQPTNPCDHALLPTALPSIISAVIVMVGWFVVNKAQVNRERRKQIREHVAVLSTDLLELEDLAIRYHTEIREKHKEQKFITKLGRFEVGCKLLPRFVESQKYLKAIEPEKLEMDWQRVQVMRKAMTLKHYGDEHTAPFDPHHQFITDIRLAAEDTFAALGDIRLAALD